MKVGRPVKTQILKGSQQRTITTILWQKIVS